LIAVELKIAGATEVVNGLKQIARELRDYRVPFLAAREDIQAHFARVFESEGAEIEQHWPDLSKYWRIRKAKSGKWSPNKLIMTGKMHRKLTQVLSVRASKMRVSYGVNLRYAPAITWGSKNGRFPKRVVALWGETAKEQFLNRMDSHLKYMLERFAGR